MSQSEYNDFANKVVSIERMRGFSEWKYKKEIDKEDCNNDVVDRELSTAMNCVNKVNAFFNFCKSKGVTWNDFISEYRRTERKAKKVDPYQDAIDASLKRIADKKKKEALKEQEEAKMKKAAKLGYSKKDIETKPIKEESDDE